ncbi:TetR/AcrR family transcriptional regulator [Aliiglaciecola litoralis]|uniref:HTH tetR-type domain-containing protein n=1 Tax=Aliiglaciecola litoralis TaxID=582857 RepID=A0ABN1LDA7_9ALTE
MSSLQEKKAAFTRDLIMQSAIELAQECDIGDMSFKRVSENANISERTMFRYYTTRDAFLDELTLRLHALLELPALPEDASLLSGFLVDLYEKLDAQPRIVEVLFTSDLFDRVLHTTAKDRYLQLITLLEKSYPHCSNDMIKKSAANIRYILSASSWRYYRLAFGFDLKTSIESADMLVSQSLLQLKQGG